MGLPRFKHLLYSNLQLQKYQKCICIKVPEGNIENYSKEKIVLNGLYKLYINSEEVYTICSYERNNFFHERNIGLLIRDKEWFDEHFATDETIRDIRIDELLK